MYRNERKNRNSLIKTKLSSEAGASILYALLLFLVCAAVSAIVLVAATTAAGRMANAAETDQRYYAVTSATGLIKDMMSDQHISVMTIDNTTISIAKPMSEVTIADINTELNAKGAQLITDDDVEDDTDHPITRPEIDGSSEAASELARVLAEYCITDSGNPKPFSFTITVKDNAGSTLENLTAKADVTIDTYNNATIIVYNNDEEKPFRMTMKFTSSTDEVNPAISEAIDVKYARELTWQLDKVMTDYDYSVIYTTE